MGILALILQVLLALPSLIKLIKDLLDLIDGQDAVEKRVLMKDFRGILMKHRKGKFADTDALEKDLVAFHESLSQKYS